MFKYTCIGLVTLQTRLEKTGIPAFAYPGLQLHAYLNLLFYDLLCRRLAWALYHWACEHKKQLAQQENLQVCSR